MEIFRIIQEELEAGRPHVLCVVTETNGSVPRKAGSKMLVFPNGSTRGSVGGGGLEKKVIEQALESINTGKPETLAFSEEAGKKVLIYIEPLLPQERVVIIGAGHVGRAVAELARRLGFMVIICDDREAVLDEINEEIADVKILSCIEDLNGNLNLGNSSYVVLTTRNAEMDIQLLPGIIETNPAYIGVIGSKNRWKGSKDGLLKAGVEQAEIEKIHAPIGLRINAETPEEIAVSIMAEMITERRKEK